MQGILIVDKPMDWTSFDVVAKLRGVLLVTQNRSPNFARYFSSSCPCRLESSTTIRSLFTLSFFSRIKDAIERFKTRSAFTRQLVS